MQIQGNRVLVRKQEEVKKEGFQTVDVSDPFLNKGVVEQTGVGVDIHTAQELIHQTILFAKYSPDTHEYDNKKIVAVDDILAIL